MPLFRINELGGNWSHVIDKYISYTYPYLPVGVRWHYFRRMFAFITRRLKLSLEWRSLYKAEAVFHPAIAGAIQVFNEPFLAPRPRRGQARDTNPFASLSMFCLNWSPAG